MCVCNKIKVSLYWKFDILSLLEKLNQATIVLKF